MRVYIGCSNEKPRLTIAREGTKKQKSFCARVNKFLSLNSGNAIRRKKFTGSKSFYSTIPRVRILCRYFRLLYLLAF